MALMANAGACKMLMIFACMELESSFQLRCLFVAECKWQTHIRKMVPILTYFCACIVSIRHSGKLGYDQIEATSYS